MEMAPVSELQPDRITMTDIAALPWSHGTGCVRLLGHWKRVNSLDGDVGVEPMGIVWSYVSGDRASLRQSAFYKAYKINDALGQKLLAVGLGKKQLFELHQIFSLMDKDSSGEINLMEFFDYIDLKRTRFSEKAFAVMDRDGSGEVDFVEFVLAVWNYCSFSRGSLVRYAFDLYDTDGSGEIELAEAGQCVREIWGSEWEKNANAQKVMTKLEGIMRSTPNNRLSVQMFQSFAQTHPMLLFPAFQLQTEIQHRVLGERFWQKAANRRSLIDPKELNMKSFEKLVHLSHQNSQTCLQTVDDVVHDNIFEDVNAAPRPRKQSTLGHLFSKVKSRRSKVFLDTKAVDAENDVDDTESSPTTVAAFDYPSSPKARKLKPKRPPPVETSVSSFASNTTVSEATASSPAHPSSERSPKKKKAMVRTTPTAAPKTDLVVEDVAEPPS